jgi:hypothetical protein
MSAEEVEAYTNYGGVVMRANQELRAIDKPGPEAPITTRNISSALRPTDPAKQGDQTFICPHCKTPLVENTNNAGVAGIEALQCYVCGNWSSGKDLPRG